MAHVRREQRVSWVQGRCCLLNPLQFDGCVLLPTQRVSNPAQSLAANMMVIAPDCKVGSMPWPWMGRYHLGEVSAELLHEREEHALAQGQGILAEQLHRIQLLAQPYHPPHIRHVQHPPESFLIPGNDSSRRTSDGSAKTRALTISMPFPKKTPTASPSQHAFRKSKLSLLLPDQLLEGDGRILHSRFELCHC
jgi:hypothetical protein